MQKRKPRHWKDGNLPRTPSGMQKIELTSVVTKSEVRGGEVEGDKILDGQI